MLKVIITKIFIIITKRVTKNIEEIIVQKCKVFDNSYSSPDKEIMALSQEIECLKKSLDSYRSDLKTVKDTSHNILGSIAYVASEYDDFHDKMSQTVRSSSIDHIAAKQEMTEIPLARLK